MAVDFYIGGAVGVVSAVVGGLLQYRISRQNGDTLEDRLPGCIFIVAGFLGVSGLFMAVGSYILTGGLRSAIVPGIGVLVGFFAGFVVVLLAWFLRPRRR